MHELTLTLPDELYKELQTKAASQGLPIEGFIVKRLVAEMVNIGQRDEEQHRLREVLSLTGLVQPVSADLVATYVTDPTAPRQNPVQMQGKPLSTIIIEQRDERG